jgi:hypothetical protein
VTDERPVADGDASGVLESAAHVDEDRLAEGQVPAEFAVERREDGDALVHMPSGQLGEQGAHLVGRVVPGVQPSDGAQSLLGHAVHEQVQLRSALDQLSAIHMIQEFLQVHDVILPL